MGNATFSIKSYLSHWLFKEDIYSLQGPYLFNLIKGLSEFRKHQKDKNLDIEAFRKKLLRDSRIITVDDLGAGSKKAGKEFRKICDITRYSTSSRKFAQLYQYFCAQTPAKKVLELGTCMGISTRYLSRVTKGKLYTIEGSTEIQKIACRDFDQQNVEFILGPIEEKLPQLPQQIDPIDFALIDANHTYEGTLFAFQTILPHLETRSIVAIGDIHWSPEMNQAWKEIQSHPEVKISLDFYECGILLFDYSGSKHHLILDY
ncbi:O-methyltransferase [Algoriphagus hitonicola]|uniref:Methyltransferase domain-containing protein n=1 Tax=Algoriphagus hitonicola TaxID=435880 RepID=A0A1I2NK19_9BACT|nr:class I SAM-dependent methyltransferase [Algoriphagus hitonicola]SFG01806.1 Methyltransferase domain-containing protein [Algoriphagus hitonicola]